MNATQYPHADTQRRTSPAIREAGPADAEALAGLATQLGYPSTIEALVARLQQVRSDGAAAVFVAVDASGSVVGWTHVVRRTSLEDEPFAELAGLIVADGARGAGIGAGLLHAAEAWARGCGIAKLRVCSNVVRARAHGFYRREGYVERKRQVVFEKPLA